MRWRGVQDMVCSAKTVEPRKGYRNVDLMAIMLTVELSTAFSGVKQSLVVPDVDPGEG